jgi:hypothetical protein
MSGVCNNTGVNTDDCRCLECRPETLAFSEFIGKLETIEDLLKGFNIPMSLRFKLLEMERQDYFIDRLTSDHIVFKRLSRDGFYWMRCDCGNIIEVPIGESWTEYCNKCNPQESDSSASRRSSIFFLPIFVPIGISALWLLFSAIGILPTLGWPLGMMPLFLLGAPGFTLLIWFQIDQYKLRKGRRSIRNLVRGIGKC